MGIVGRKNFVGGRYFVGESKSFERTVCMKALNYNSWMLAEYKQPRKAQIKLGSPPRGTEPYESCRQLLIQREEGNS